MTETTSSQSRTTEPLLPKAWDVPPAFRYRLGDDVGRQRLMTADDHMLLVLHGPPKPGENLRRGRLFWRNPAGQWKPTALKHGEHPIGELLTEYESLIDSFDRAERDADEAAEYLDLLTNVAPLLRTCRNLLKVLQDARDEAKEDRALILLRDRAYNLSRRVELLQQDAQNTLSYITARRAEEQAASSERQAKAAHRLNILAALFFPLATLTGIMGMNRELYAPWSTASVLAMGIAFGIALAVYVTRK